MGSKRGYSGVTWSDVAIYLREVEQHHNVTLVLEIKPDGALFGGTLWVSLRWTAPQLVAPGKVMQGEMREVWPRGDYKLMESLAYQLVHRVDHELGRTVWKQAAMPF